MKIFIDYELDNPRKASTGKGKFLSLLIPELGKLGVESSTYPKGCDVHLGISWFNTDTDLPKVLRIDGLSFDKAPAAISHSMKKAKKSVKIAGAIIWQSNFCKKILSQLFDVSGKREKVIFNGAQCDIECTTLYNVRYKKNVVLSAHWYKNGHERTNKRLKETIDIIYKYIKQREDVRFIILGETNYKSNNLQIMMPGHLTNNVMFANFGIANCMLYLAYYDWCPNSVVEALCVGVPVICSNNSGIAEIVGTNGGTILDLDKELELKDLYLYKKHPPPVDHEKVFKALDYYCENKIRINKPELHIENIAKQYKEFLFGRKNT